MRRVTLSEALFGAAVLFSFKALVLPDVVAIAGLLIWLSAFFVERFFAVASAERKALARIEAMEAELKEVKRLQTQSNLAQGIRPASFK